MASIGDFDEIGCDCPTFPAPAGGLLAPGAHTVGDFDAISCPCPSVIIDSPAALATIAPAEAIVFDALAPEGIGSVLVTFTDAGGIVTTAFLTATGFDAAYAGSIAVIADGQRFTVTRLSGWVPGALRIDVTVTDNNGASASGSRSWTVGVPVSTTLVTQALSRVIKQYQQRPKLAAEITALAYLWQQLIDVLNAMPPLDDLGTATGINLDVDGEVVGQVRQLSNGDVPADPQYRILIGARITRNNARVDGDSFLSYLVNFFGATVQLTDFGGMSITYQVARAPTADELAVLNSDIVARPMGVNITRQWYDPSYFRLEEASDPGGFGLADDSGGYPGVGGGNLITDF